MIWRDIVRLVMRTTKKSVIWADTNISLISVGHYVHIQCSKLFKVLECTVLSMVLCTIKDPWSHSIKVRHSPDFRLPSVAILPWLCRKRRKAIFTHWQEISLHGVWYGLIAIYLPLCPPHSDISWYQRACGRHSEDNVISCDKEL